MEVSLEEVSLEQDSLDDLLWSSVLVSLRIWNTRQWRELHYGLRFLRSNGEDSNLGLVVVLFLRMWRKRPRKMERGLYAPLFPQNWEPRRPRI